MRVYFTFEPREDLRLPLVADFPEVDFVFDTTLQEKHLGEADVIVTYGDDLHDAHIKLAKKLQWIFVASAGIEKMPAQAIVEKGILVTNVRGIHKKPMTESVLAHILALKRGLPFLYEQQKQGQWNKKTSLSELNGSTALIIGPGAIGAEIGRILQAFGVYTIGCNRSGQPIASMDETHTIKNLSTQLVRADIIISMLPSTQETQYLVTYEHFEKMKDTAIFMNFGRGDLVKESDLVKALQNQLIAHAVLDVFEVEPLPTDSQLWQLKNVTISPHFSSHSSRYVERALEIFKPSLRKWMSGEHDLENKVDLLRGY